MNKIVKWFVVSMVLVIMSVNICACSDVSAAEVEGDYTSYMCDYKGFSFNTKITTVVDDKEVTIQGKILRFATDPLEMVDKDGNVLAQATDSYNFINQDDHGIIVDGVVELVMQGNFEMVGNSYKLYDGDGEEIGRAEFGWLCSGTIYDINNNVVAILRKIAKEATIFPDNATIVSFTPFEIKMLHTALHHQWINMTDDNGQAVNCRQESADCVYNLLKKFEALNAETEKEG